MMTIAIAIAPILAKAPTQASSVESSAATDISLAGADFASLLLGQLAIGTELPQTDTETAAISTAAGLLDASSLDTTSLDTTADATASPQDAAMLLAALGITQPQAHQDRKLSADSIAGSGVATDMLLAGNGKKASPVLPTAETAQSDATLGIDPKTQAGLSVPLETGEKAAKFAVPDFAEQKTGALTIRSQPGESGTPQTLATAPLPTNNAPVQNTSHRVDTPLRDASWSGDFAQKVVWLTANDQKFAQLTLNPPQMGPIEISLNINKDSASAYFVSPNAEVREAIETALPRLREMLAGAGIELGQTNVSAQSSRQENGQEARHGTPRWMADEAILDSASLRNQAIIAQRGNSLVDTFA
jgi:flagellar hook-length control protein FliK